LSIDADPDVGKRRLQMLSAILLVATVIVAVLYLARRRARLNKEQ
jgi:hypothetical protein